MTRILFVIPTLLTGGTERQLFLLAKGLAKTNNFYIEVVSLYKDGEIAWQLRQEGIVNRCVGMRNIYDFTGYFKLRRLIIKGRFDIVHNFLFDANVWGGFAAYSTGTKVIISSRRDIGAWRKRRHIILERLGNLFSDKIVVNAQAIKDYTVLQERAPLSKIEVINNGIELASQEGKDAKSKNKKEILGLSEDVQVATMVGTLSEKKRQDVFLRSAREVLKEDRNVRFVLVGRGPREKNLKLLAKELGIEKSVIFLGFREDIQEILIATDLLALTSDFEGMPNVILEAMACGLPVVGTRVGGIPEVVEDGISGILVKPDNPLEVSNAVKLLLQETALRQKMGRRGREIIEQRFGLNKMIESYSSVYSQLLKSSCVSGVS